MKGFVAELNELHRAGDVEVFGPPYRDRLEVLVAHYGAHAQSAGAGAALLDRRKQHLALTCHTDGGHRGARLFEFLFDEFLGLEGAHTRVDRGVANLDFVVVNPDIDQVGGLSFDDDFVVARVFQLRPPEAAHHRERKEPCLGGDCGDDGAVGSGSRSTSQQASTENEHILCVKGLNFWRNEVPQHPSVGTQAAQVKFGQARIARHALDTSASQIDLEIEPCLCVPHSLPLLSSEGALEAVYPSRKSAVC